MQVAIIYIGHSKELQEYTKIFSASLSEKRHIPTFINGLLERPRLGFYQNIIFFVESPKFLGKNYLEELSIFLKEVGKINSRYASIFTNKTISSDKYLLKYMKRIENEGLILYQTGIFKDSDEAKKNATAFTPIKAGE